jgi:peptide methionine sulfoxide reductase MsrB
VLGIFDLVYHATVSTHMDKSTSMIQIEIAQSTDNNSMLGHASDFTIVLQSNKGSS